MSSEDVAAAVALAAGNGGDELQQRRVLRIQAEVLYFPILIAGVEMSTLIDRLRVAQRKATTRR